MDYYYKKFKCLQIEETEHDSLFIHGDYNAACTRSLVFQFEKCRNQTDSTAANGAETAVTCKSDEEIYSWLQRKFILLKYNQRRFRLETFDSDKVVEESKTAWIPITSL